MKIQKPIIHYIILFSSLILLVVSNFLEGNAQGIISRKKQPIPKETQKTKSSITRQNTKEIENMPESLSQPDIPPYSEGSGFVNGHGYVDLGLPSGVKWAMYNIGAENPVQSGDYFAYGETDTKKSYDKYNCPVRYKFSLKSDGIFNHKGTLAQSHDPAKVNWGRSWSLPTKSEWKELMDKCKWTWTSFQGKMGCKVTGPNGNSIFFPAFGKKNGNRNEELGKAGFYLSSELGETKADEDSVYIVTFDEKSLSPNLKSMGPYYGFSVRPVLKTDISKIPSEELNTVWSTDSYEENTRRTREISEPDGYINGHGYVDLGLPSGLKWAYGNVGSTKNPQWWGNLYPWGETQCYSSIKQKNKKSQETKKLKAKNIIDENCNLNSTHDAAHIEMGGSWRMPSKDDFTELLENCEWTVFEYLHMKGLKIIGPNGHSIFISEGMLGSKSGRSSWDKSYYWTSTAGEKPLSSFSYELVFLDSSVKIETRTNRNEGLPIRAVSK